MLRTRAITAFIILPFVIWSVFAGGWWFLALVSLLALPAGWEFGRMMRAGHYAPTTFFIVSLIALLLFDGFSPELGLFKPGVTILIVLALIWQLFRTASTAPPVDWALAVAGGLYIGLGAAHLIALRGMANGLSWVWLALLCTWGADTFAYLVGRAIGRHKFWPRYSPGKTWEGFAGGVGGGLLGGAIVAVFFDVAWVHALTVGLLVPIIAPLGDLAISMMKRHVGVKDTSHILPGHGGVLDRVDTLLVVSIFVFYYAVWVAS